jgi:outer membrane receptor for Fe3+-dicitrate
MYFILYVMGKVHGTITWNFSITLQLAPQFWKKGFVCIMGIDNIENLHSWAKNIHQNQKDTVLYIFTLYMFCVYSKTCVNRPPLGPRFTAGIDRGPVYSVSTLWLPYKWFFHGGKISRFSSKLVDFISDILNFCDPEF